MPARSMLSGAVIALPFFLLMLSRIFGWQQPFPSPRQQGALPEPTTRCDDRANRPPDEARARVDFAGRDIIAYAWPSEGGLLHRDVDGLDLQHLGVSRTASTPRSDPFDQIAEDQWADRLRQLAPQWTPNEDDRDVLVLGWRHQTPIERAPVYVAWPPDSSGVWVLRFTDPWNGGGEPPGFAAYHACLTAAERCDVVEKFGGQFYENPDEVYELSKEYTEEFRRQRAEFGGPVGF